MKKFVSISNASTKKYKKLLESIDSKNICPFCEDFVKKNKKKFHTKPIIKEGKYWALTKNMFPYDGTSIHLMFVYKKHIRFISEITSVAMKELFSFIAFAEKKFNLKYYSIFTRNGDINFTGSSVDHIHLQLIAGNSGADNSEPLRVKLGYKK